MPERVDDSLRSAAAVLGAGVVSPAGSTLDEFWDVIQAAAGTRAEVVTFDEVNDLQVLACRAHGFDPASRLSHSELRRLDRVHQMAFWAADDALAQAGDGPEPARCAVVVGIGYGAAEFLSKQRDALLSRGVRAVSPLTVPVVMPNSVAAHLSLRYGYRGPVLTVAAACASGAVAIGEALWLLRTGRADRVLAGGADALIHPDVVSYFTRMEAMSSRFGEPLRSSRPFDVGRDGFVLGEGAGFVVLERTSAHHPGQLGAILGYATNADSSHLVAPSEDGEGAVRCMRAALADAGIEAEEVGHINAHGTSTRRNDVAEFLALASVFGDRAVPVTATKGVIGHLLGGAGAVETIATLLTSRRMVVPPIANLLEADIGNRLLLAEHTLPADSSVGLTNSFAFGGHNASLVIG